jgi:hypothetical protein
MGQRIQSRVRLHARDLRQAEPDVPRGNVSALSLLVRDDPSESPSRSTGMASVGDAATRTTDPSPERMFKADMAVPAHHCPADHQSGWPAHTWVMPRLPTLLGPSPDHASQIERRRSAGTTGATSETWPFRRIRSTPAAVIVSAFRVGQRKPSGLGGTGTRSTRSQRMNLGGTGSTRCSYTDCARSEIRKAHRGEQMDGPTLGSLWRP